MRFVIGGRKGFALQCIIFFIQNIVALDRIIVWCLKAEWYRIKLNLLHFDLLDIVINTRQLISIITLVSNICFSLISTGTWNQTCFSSKNLVRLNVSPNKQTRTMIILVLLIVQIERASNGLQTTMNLEIGIMMIYLFLFSFYSWNVAKNYPYLNFRQKLQICQQRRCPVEAN